MRFVQSHQIEIDTHPGSSPTIHPRVAEISVQELVRRKEDKGLQGRDAMGFQRIKCRL